jgi:hypothetical protein
MCGNNFCGEDSPTHGAIAVNSSKSERALTCARLRQFALVRGQSVRIPCADNKGFPPVRNIEVSHPN